MNLKNKQGVPYPDNWTEISYAVKKAFGFTCQICLRNSIDEPGIHLNTHHKDHYPQNNNDDNLVPFCQNCQRLFQALEAPIRRRYPILTKAIKLGQQTLPSFPPPESLTFERILDIARSSAMPALKK